MMSVFEHICALVSVLCCDRCVYEAAWQFSILFPYNPAYFPGQSLGMGCSLDSLWQVSLTPSPHPVEITVAG